VLAWLGNVVETIGRVLSLLWALLSKPRLDAVREPDPVTAPREPGVSPATTGNALELLLDGDEIAPALLQEIGAAKKSIWINVFEFQSDATAASVAAALIAAKARGVDVKLVIDNRHGVSEMTDGPPKNALLEQLAAAKCDVRYVDRAGISVNHRKLMVFDGARAIVTGANIGGNYLLPLAAGWSYHDAAVRIAGPAVRDVAAVFDESWRGTGGKPLTLPDRLPPVPGADAGAVQVVSHAGGRDRSIEREIVQRIDAETKRIVLVNGFGMSHAIKEALLAARQRGVSVTWEFGSASDQASLMAQASFPALRAAGVQIVRYPHPLHMKAYVFGDDKLIVGSSNMDGFSTWLNDEAVLQVSSRAFVQKFLARVVEPDLRVSAPLTGDVITPASVKDRAVEGLGDDLID
jgi:cardiolipin synthase